MKNYTPAILILISMLIGCSKPEKVTLTGTLGGTFESEILLEQEGDKFSGYFIYADNRRGKIEVRGVKAGETLRLEEFNNEENKLTGIFEGPFDGNTYKGFWTDPARKKKVPFIYRKKEQDKSSIEAAHPATIKKIEEAYSAWVDEQVEEGAYWYMSQREKHQKNIQDKKLPEGKEPWDNCLDGLPEKFKNAHYGDINRDGITDGWATIFPFYCMDGTWQINADIHLFFLSKPDGSYEVLEENFPIGPAGYLDTILPDGTMKFTGVDYGPQDAHCCPTKKWGAEFVYKNGRFEEKK